MEVRPVTPGLTQAKAAVLPHAFPTRCRRRRPCREVGGLSVEPREAADSLVSWLLVGRFPQPAPLRPARAELISPRNMTIQIARLTYARHGRLES